MKKKITTISLFSLILSMFFIACNPDETVTPVVVDEPTPNAGPDTTVLFGGQNWRIDKVANAGVDDPSSFLIGTSYSMFDDGTYAFNIPDFPSAFGTWEFDASGKHTVLLHNQGSGSVWTIRAISETKMTIDDKSNGGGAVWTYEMTNF